MTSSMLAGERKWASARRGGMTVLGKVAVPKPLNLPSQRLENHGLDPNVEIVPKGGLSWGNRPSSSTSNPWGSSSLKADGTAGSPSRPSTAGSDRTHQPAASAWVPNSRPSSASGVLTSNQSSLAPRPHSAETRPGSSYLSRFAEPVSDNSTAWGPNGIAEKLLMPSKNNDFSLSFGDFPTLGSEKDNAGKSSESHDHGSHVRPSSASGRIATANESNVISQADIKSATVNTWTRDGPLHVEDVDCLSADKWQVAQQQYVNPNIHPQHFDTWCGPPMNSPPGAWYRGPPAGPPYPHVPHGGFPVEPFPYYHPHINSQPCPPAGVGPRGHHPKNGDFYRPHMPDPFVRPVMPFRPDFYPGPLPYDGYYGPPMGYNPNEHSIPFMGMPPGPPVYNMYPAPNPSEPSDPHFRASGCGSTGCMLVPEQLDSVKVHRKHQTEWDAGIEESNWGPTTEKGGQLRPSSRKNEWGADSRRNEDAWNLGNQGNYSDSVIVHSREGMHKSKTLDDSWAKKSETGATTFPEVPQKPKDSCSIQKIEGLDPEVRKDAASAPQFSRRSHNGVQSRAGHISKGRLNNQDANGWQKNPPVLVPDHHISMEAIEKPENTNPRESSTPISDSIDAQAQRAKMRELVKQRAIQLQKEEEERIKEQKAKALAKLEELNRRTLAADVETTQPPSEPLTAASKHQAPSSDSGAKPEATSRITENINTNLENNVNILHESTTYQRKKSTRSSKNRHIRDETNNNSSPHTWAPPDIVLTPPPKNGSSAQMNLKNRKAEMGREIHKPVVKEPVRQGSNRHLETTEGQDFGSGSQSAIPASGDGDNKQNKPVKSRETWRQRGLNESYRGPGLSLAPNSSKNHRKSGQHEPLNPVPTKTNIIHEWDLSDGWHMPEYSPEASPVVKDQAGIIGKGKRQTNKGGQRSLVNVSNADVDIIEHRSSHRQPGQNPCSDESNARAPELQHVSSGFRKNGGQNRQRQSSHYKYQPVGSCNNDYNSNNTSKFDNLDGPTEGSRGAASRNRDRGPGQSRRGGGNLHGQHNGYDL